MSSPTIAAEHRSVQKLHLLVINLFQFFFAVAEVVNVTDCVARLLRYFS